MEFRKLYRFDTNQVTEKGAEMHWRHKYNNYKDTSLDFTKFIKDKDKLTFKCYVDVINFSEINSLDEEGDKQLNKQWVIDEYMKTKLMGMQHGDHLYLHDNFGRNERFAVFVGYYHGVYNIFLQQLFPNMIHKNDDNKDVMVTEIDRVIFKVGGIEYGKVLNIRLSAGDDIVLSAKMWGREWMADNGDKKELIFEIDLSGIS